MHPVEIYLPVSQYDASTRASFWPQSVLIVIMWISIKRPYQVELN